MDGLQEVAFCFQTCFVTQDTLPKTDMVSRKMDARFSFVFFGQVFRCIYLLLVSGRLCIDLIDYFELLVGMTVNGLPCKMFAYLLILLMEEILH